MRDDLFRTAAGIPVPSLRTEEMRAVDRVAVENIGLTLLQMMENAGRALASQVFEVGGDSALVVAGNGGNGGGGLACARHLANHGVAVEIALDRWPDELAGAAGHQYRILDEMDVPAGVGPDALRGEGNENGDENGERRVFVDALIGYGLTDEVRAPARGMIEEINRRAGPTVSLDVPSGIDATTGRTLGVAVEPTRIVTLALPKTGLADLSVPLTLADIGIPRTVYDRLEIDYEPPFDHRSVVELRRR